jgi:hypothetical protein
MNKKQITASLNDIANQLDQNGLHSEANTVTEVLFKVAQLDMSKVKDTAVDVITTPVRMERELIKNLKGEKDFVPSLSDPKISKYIGQSLADLGQFEIRINQAGQGRPLIQNATANTNSMLAQFLDPSINALNKASTTFNAKMKGHSSVGTIGIRIPDSAWQVPVSKTSNMAEFTEQFAKFVQLQRRVYANYSSLYPDVASYLAALNETLSNFRLYTK